MQENTLQNPELQKYKNIKIGEYSLGDVQESILSIMVVFDRFCREHNINYILDGGSMLGAIRHRGFIPWDDDMDVAMLRKDYKKFIKLWNKKHDPGYEFYSTKTCKIWPFNFGKVKKNNTIYSEDYLGNLPIHQGIWVDVFPLDKTCKPFFKVQCTLSRIWQGVRWTKSGIKECDCFRPRHIKILKLLSFLPYWFINLNQEISIRFLNILPLKNVSKLCHPGKGKVPHSKKYYEDIIECDFENHRFFIPKEYSVWLNERYSNPMKLPNENDRRPSHTGSNKKIIL